MCQAFDDEGVIGQCEPLAEEGMERAAWVGGDPGLFGLEGEGEGGGHLLVDHLRGLERQLDDLEYQSPYCAYRSDGILVFLQAAENAYLVLLGRCL